MTETCSFRDRDESWKFREWDCQKWVSRPSLEILSMVKTTKRIWRNIFFKCNVAYIFVEANCFILHRPWFISAYCFQDSSKAFDWIFHVELFEKLIQRTVSICFVRLLKQWYCCNCNFSVGVALNVRFTTNGMCVKNNIHMLGPSLAGGTHFIFCPPQHFLVKSNVVVQISWLHYCWKRFPSKKIGNRWKKLTLSLDYL